MTKEEAIQQFESAVNLIVDAVADKNWPCLTDVVNAMERQLPDYQKALAVLKEG